MFWSSESIKLGSAVQWLLAFSGENSPDFPCIAIGLKKKKKKRKVI